MARVILMIVLAIIVSRAFRRLVGGVIEGLGGHSRATRARQVGGVQMVRDPVCGTFVVPGSALTLADGRRQLYFCSTDCRDKYRARTA